MKNRLFVTVFMTVGFGVNAQQPAYVNCKASPDTLFFGYQNVLRYNAPQCDNKVTFSCTGGTLGRSGDEYVVTPQVSSKTVTVNMYCASNSKKAVATRIFTVLPLSKERAEKLRNAANSKDKK